MLLSCLLLLLCFSGCTLASFVRCGVCVPEPCAMLFIDCVVAENEAAAFRDSPTSLTRCSLARFRFWQKCVLLHLCGRGRQARQRRRFSRNERNKIGLGSATLTYEVEKSERAKAKTKRERHEIGGWRQANWRQERCSPRGKAKERYKRMLREDADLDHHLLLRSPVSSVSLPCCLHSTAHFTTPHTAMPRHCASRFHNLSLSQPVSHRLDNNERWRCD